MTRKIQDCSLTSIKHFLPSGPLSPSFLLSPSCVRPAIDHNPYQLQTKLSTKFSWGPHLIMGNYILLRKLIQFVETIHIQNYSSKSYLLPNWPPRRVPLHYWHIWVQANILGQKASFRIIQIYFGTMDFALVPLKVLNQPMTQSGTLP